MLAEIDRNGKTFDAHEIKQRATGRWGEVIPALAGIDPALLDGKHHPCPKCGGTDRFSAFNDFKETGGVICRKCFSEQNGDGLSAVAWMLSIDFNSACRRVADYLGMHRVNGHARHNGHAHASTPKSATDWGAEADRHFHHPDAETKRLQLAQTLGVELAPVGGRLGSVHDPAGVLSAVGVGWFGDRWTIPERDASGKVVGIATRMPDGSKRFLPGGNRGLVFAGDWLEDDGPVLAVEGMTDTAAGLKLGLCTIGRHTAYGGAGMLADLVRDVPGDRQIIVLGEVDPKPDGSWPGRDGAVRVAGKLADTLSRPVHWALCPDGAKDLREWSQRSDANGEEFLRRLQLIEVKPGTPADDLTEADQHEPAGEEPILPVPIGELIERHPRLRKPVIHGLAREGETVNVVAPSKAKKSWLGYSLLLSLTTGRDWLDVFPCEAGRVLLIDNELHAEDIAHRIPAVADAMGITLAEYRDRYDVISLRGRLLDYYGLGRRVVSHIEAGHYRAILVDAHYRMLPPGVSENDNAAMAQVFNQIDGFAAQTQAAWFLIHHSSKGNQAAKDVTDVGSGAGSQSRAADSHLVLRQHEEPDHTVLEAAVRSWPPVEPATLQWCFPVWRPSNRDPAKLKGRLAKNEERQNARDREGFLDIADVLRKWNRDEDGPATINQITDKMEFGRDRTRNLLSKMCRTGEVKRMPVTFKGNDTHEYDLVGSEPE